MTQTALKPAEPDTARASESARNDPVNILVVDDLPEKLMAYEAILEELGQKLITARSGEEALKLVLREEFAVILLDVNMPGMDGFETASLIRARRKSAHTPIIFLTAFTDEMRMAQGYASGAVDYLPTPVVPEILKAKVRVFIELSQMRRQAALQAEEHALRTAAEEAAERSAFLADAGEKLARAASQGDILSLLAALPIPYLADACLLRLNDLEPGQHAVQAALRDTSKEVHAASADALLQDAAWLQAAIERVMQSGQWQLSFAAYPPILADSERAAFPLSLVSALVLPLSIRGVTSGTLALLRTSENASFMANEISLANDLAVRASIALENARLMQKIQEADRRKNEFLAMLAHELRNPLAPIRNALEIMKRDVDPALRNQAQDTIERQLKHMVHLVDDLMDVSRITQGRIDLRKERITLKDVLDHARETAEPLLRQNRHTLDVTLPEQSLWLKADFSRLSQIFSNLLNNAAKYTNPGGHIRISAETVEDAVEISVTDNGIGIPAHMLSHIFDIFSQVDSSLERAQGGLGIGLTLARSLVEMHGGSIEARSGGEGQGSQFRVRLPLVEAPAHVEAAVTNPEANANDSAERPLRVLIVDDNEASAKTLGWMMEIIGHEPFLAHDGTRGMELARQTAPDVVLLDIGLPGLSGYDICKTLKSEPMFKDTLFIAQTGWGQQEHRERSKEAGFNHHLVKPVDMKVLQELLSRS